MCVLPVTRTASCLRKNNTENLSIYLDFLSEKKITFFLICDLYDFILKIACTYRPTGTLVGSKSRGIFPIESCSLDMTRRKNLLLSVHSQLMVTVKDYVTDYRHRLRSPWSVILTVDSHSGDNDDCL